MAKKCWQSIWVPAAAEASSPLSTEKPSLWRRSIALSIIIPFWEVGRTGTSREFLSISKLPLPIAASRLSAWESTHGAWILACWMPGENCWGCPEVIVIPHFPGAIWRNSGRWWEVAPGCTAEPVSPAMNITRCFSFGLCEKKVGWNGGLRR